VRGCDACFCERRRVRDSAAFRSSENEEALLQPLLTLRFWMDMVERTTTSPCRRVERGRLAYYSQQADRGYWQSVWDSILGPGFYEPYLQGSLDFYVTPFTKYLPQDGRILEAGAGTAQYVVALRSRGFDCVGIDYAQDTVCRVKSIFPELPLEVGDVTNMHFADASFAAILSIGVVEHRREGPEPFLREMRRVLADSGRLLVSVPHFNALRRYRASRGAYRDDCSGTEFYQWAYTPAEFRQILSKEGWKVVDVYDYDFTRCLHEELVWLDRLPSWISRLLVKGASFVPGVRSRLGHMRMYVAQKADAV
jgi:SAM-dependent methyltransferase